MSEDTAAVIERLESAEATFSEANAAVDAIEGSAVTSVPEQLRQFESILDAYEDRATGSGDFTGYVAFRREISTFVADLPSDLAAREAFEAAEEALEQRRLQQRHFDRARAALAPAREIADALQARREAARALREARSAATQHRAELEERINELEQLQRYRDIDLDASVEPLRASIERYNDAVREAFETFRQDRPAAAVLELFALTDHYPLVDMPAPPPGLLRTVRAEEFDDLTVPELLEYADYSRSKLAHYVDDPAALQDAVAEDRLYLDRLDATPFEVAWPPPPAAELRWQLRELVSVVDRFAGSPALSALHEVRRLARKEDRYAELRRWPSRGQHSMPRIDSDLPPVSSMTISRGPGTPATESTRCWRTYLRPKPSEERARLHSWQPSI